MNQDRIKGEGNQMVGEARRLCIEPTADDVHQAARSADKLFTSSRCAAARPATGSRAASMPRTPAALSTAKTARDDALSNHH